jgi:hypothetical protein
MVKAPQIPTKHPDAVKNGAVSFAGQLDDGEALTGTPTAAAAGLTVDNVRVSTADLTVNGQTVPAGKAVQFRVAGGANNTTYEIKVTCGTTSSPAQTLVVECPLAVLDA